MKLYEFTSNASLQTVAVEAENMDEAYRLLPAGFDKSRGTTASRIDDGPAFRTLPELQVTATVKDRAVKLSWKEGRQKVYTDYVYRQPPTEAQILEAARFAVSHLCRPIAVVIR